LLAVTRVARWFIFNPKIPIWVNFGGPWIEKCWYMDIGNIWRTFGIFHDCLLRFVFIWYIFSGFGIIDQEKSGNPGRHAQFNNVYIFDDFQRNSAKPLWPEDGGSFWGSFSYFNVIL
jgi:hypothetical protein